MNSKIREILNSDGAEPVVFAYNQNGNLNLELADSVNGDKQDELAGKLMQLIREYY